MILSAVVTKEGKFYVALAPDIDVASQGDTIEDALSNLKEAIDLYFEDEDSIRPEINERPIITLIEASP
ncbi:MAG: type II toxin-antitoxin system HicB family antitoxin [Candidatus Thorarchaeota archaeon]|nr:type II toxin-antitoxin system HicB family antitoxin [Candidatus Thorarchaeota archaeon]